MEAHATGTRVGDPIESRAIGKTVGAVSMMPLPPASLPAAALQLPSSWRPLQAQTAARA